MRTFPPSNQGLVPTLTDEFIGSDPSPHAPMQTSVAMAPTGVEPPTLTEIAPPTTELPGATPPWALSIAQQTNASIEHQLRQLIDEALAPQREEIVLLLQPRIAELIKVTLEEKIQEALTAKPPPML